MRCRDPAPVDFEFGLTGSARSDAAAEAREFGAGSDQIRLTVAQLRQLDLHLPFAAARVSRKNVQNQHRAIHDRQRNDLFEIPSLPRAQIVENQEQVGSLVVRPLRDLARLSAADERRGIHAHRAAARCARGSARRPLARAPRARRAPRRSSSCRAWVSTATTIARCVMIASAGAMRLDSSDPAASGSHRYSAVPGRSKRSESIE